LKSLLFAAAAFIALPALAQEPDHSAHLASPQQTAPPTAAPAPAPPAPADEHAGHDMSAMGGEVESQMRGALGPYSMSREASGTAWQPDVSGHSGVIVQRGDWMLMGHAVFNGVYDWQDGPRGDEKAFVSGMVMGMAQRQFGNDVLQFKAMVSPDPLMGKRGYPLLLASGETADGVTTLVDRQHPHDLFMELAASYSKSLGEGTSAFLYAGLPGEPAFGPPAFMHRLSVMDSPEAPIAHHWLDSTHITFGVVTAGLVRDNWKIEASRFRGREPDERRFDIETGTLDSTAVRLSWNPTESLSLQASWAEVISPEQLEPDEDLTKWSASAIYTRRLVGGGWWSTTAAWGRKGHDGDYIDAYALETAVRPVPEWTVFARAEQAENNELSGVMHGPAYRVSKASIGAVRDFRVSEHATFGVGGLYAKNFVPAALEPSYGGDQDGAMAFVRLKIE
jgi:hypothetical protein